MSCIKLLESSVQVQFPLAYEDINFSFTSKENSSSTIMTPFSFREQMTLSEEQKSDILRKEEEYRGEPYNKNVMGLSDKYVGEKGEGDYGVKKLAKIDDMAEGKADRRKEIGGNAQP